MSNLQESRTHHHLPVFYLKRWCDDSGNLFVIRNFDSRVHRRKSAPKSTGCEDYLYSYHEEFQAEDRSEIETIFFKPLDDKGAQIVSKMIHGKQLEKRHRILWAQFLVAMRIRTPDIVAHVKTRGSEVLVREMKAAQAEYQRLKNSSDPDSAVDWLRANYPGLGESAGLARLPKIAANPKIINGVLAFDWHIVDFSSSSRPLLASDRPCVYTDGLDKPNCIIAMPLSPRHAFFAFRSGSDAEKHLMQMSNRNLATTLNESVVGQAEMRAYCQSLGDVEDAFIRRCLAVSENH